MSWLRDNDNYVGELIEAGLIFWKFDIQDDSSTQAASTLILFLISFNFVTFFEASMSTIKIVVVVVVTLISHIPLFGKHYIYSQKR